MLMHTEIPSIFASNPGFPLVKCTFSVTAKGLKYRILSWFDRNPKIPPLKNGNYCNTVNPLAPFLLQSNLTADWNPNPAAEAYLEPSRASARERFC